MFLLRHNHRQTYFDLTDFSACKRAESLTVIPHFVALSVITVTLSLSFFAASETFFKQFMLLY